MRAGLSTIQQTLTTEATTILNNSISEARRRNHSQTTPLHVAATLLASPTGFLRQACVNSQPNSSHPLQCRALELCFSVALERLPSSTAVGGGALASPPISNALIAALKRAQAHQRRGCPEQPQQPLLAVKVELEQLVVSILDDPSVSRVMREASFSSPAVKATIEQSMSSATSKSNSGGLGHFVMRRTATPAPNLTLYVNPRLQPQQQQEEEDEEVRKVVEILVRTKKRNPVLVGDSDPEALLKNVLERIETTGIGGGDARVLSLAKDFATSDRSSVPKKIQELIHSIENSDDNVVLDIGDLKWLVEIPPSPTSSSSQIHHHQNPVTEVGKAAVVEMGKLLRRFNVKVWAIGIASCATYLRCQVYYPTMESDWDLQAVPIAPRPPLLPNLFPRQVAAGNGILSSSVESLSATSTPFLSRYNSTQRKSTDLHLKKSKSMCHVCRESYEKELAKLDKSSSNCKPPLPLWLQAAKLTTHQIQTEEQKTEELLSKWNKTCIHLHPNSNMLLGRNLGQIPTTNSRNDPPVRTELVLGQSTTTNLELRNHRDRTEEDSVGCRLDMFSDHQNPTNTTGNDRNLDPKLFKRLFKGLTETVEWQPEAASSVALSMMQCRSGNNGSRTDVWLLFVGRDKVGKKKMTASLSQLMFGTTPVVVNLGTSCPIVNCEDGGSNVRARGKTVIDRVAEVIRRNPFSVFVLEDIDQAATVVQGSIRQAIQSGRLLDSHGREVSLAISIFILTAISLTGDDNDNNFHSSDEERVEAVSKCGGQLELLVGDWGDKTVAGKRRLEWKCESEENRRMKLRKDDSKVGGLSLDLNLAVGVVQEEDNGEGSRNSSDVTVEHEQDQGRLEIRHPGASTGLPSELIDIVNDIIVFKNVDFGPLRRKVSNAVATKFSSIIGSCGGGDMVLEVDREALDRMVGDIWFGNGAAVDGFEEWMDKVLASSFRQLKSNHYNIGAGGFVRLVLTNDRVKLPQPPTSGGLPTTITISVVDGYDDVY